MSDEAKDLSTFGERLRYLRKKRGYSQDAMQEMLGVSQGVYSGWERNRIDIPTSRLISIVIFYDVSADWLLFGDSGRQITRFAEQEEPAHVG